MTMQNQQTPIKKRYKVLAADDDPIMREMMMARLGDDVVVTCVEDGKLAWDKLSQEHFDLAIIDLGMPNLDGFGLIQYLRQTPKTVDLPLIVATSRGDQEAIERAFSSGASGFVTKPINWSLFQYEIKFVLKHGQTERELRATRAFSNKANRTKDNLLALMACALQPNIQITSNSTPDQPAPKQCKDYLSDAIELSQLLTQTKPRQTQNLHANNVIEATVNTCQTFARQKAVKLIGRKTLADISINVDPEIWTSVLLRATKRAIESSPNGGTVEILLGGQRDGSLVFSIRDNGPLKHTIDIENELNILAGDLIDFKSDNWSLDLTLPIINQAMIIHGGRPLFQSNVENGNITGLWLPNSRVKIQQLEQSA